MTAGSRVRIISVAMLCAALGACSSTGRPDLVTADYAPSERGTTPAAPADNPTLFPDDSDGAGPSTIEGTRLQCVPYAREHSGVNLRGDAYTWWDKAAGLYARSGTPSQGSVLVLNGYARHRAHVAVVRRLISPREIRIDHANWLDDGAVYVNDPVIDVSDANDWSEVKVWNIRSGSWGTRTYRVQGFIGPGPEGATPLVASYHPSLGDPIADQIAAHPTAAAYHPEPSDDPIARQIAAATADSDDSDDNR